MAETTVSDAWQMRCPHCQSDEGIDILAQVWVRLVPTGTDIFAPSDGNHHWDDSHQAQCNDCGFAGTVGKFYIEEKAQ